MNDRTTIFSPCRTYRYTLWRDWASAAEDLFNRIAACDNQTRALAIDAHRERDAETAWFAKASLSELDRSRTKNRINLSRRNEYVQFIGLNPSTADETADDPTIRRCIGFAKDWGFGALCMTNLFAFRATDPEEMMSAEHPISHPPSLCNDGWLKAIADGAGMIVAAWGTHGRFMERSAEVKAMFRSQNKVLHCLGLNNDGTPRHPLYLPRETAPIPFE